MRLIDLCLEGRWIDTRDELPFGHPCIEVCIQRKDGAGDLRAYLYSDDGIRIPRGRNGDVDIAVINRFRAEFRCRLPAENDPRSQHEKD